MSIIINSTVNEADAELDSAGVDGATSNSDTSAAGSLNSEQLDFLSKALDKMYEGDNKLDDNEREAFKDLTKLFSDKGSAESTSDSGESDSTGETDRTSESSGSELTPQEFMSKLTDVADKSEHFGDSEESMLDQGKKLMDATPEQQQAFLDKAESFMDDGNIDKEEADKLEGFADGLLAGDSEGSDSTEGAEDDSKSFMDKVDDILAKSQDGDEGPGEKMAREAAEMLKDNSSEDQEAFLAQMEKLLNNADEDHPDGDIDEKNDNEGTMLKKMAEAFEEPHSSDRSESSSSSSDSDSAPDAISNETLRRFLDEAKSDGEFSDSDISALRAMLEASEPAMAA
jgi:hypothetical protein